MANGSRVCSNGQLIKCGRFADFIEMCRVNDGCMFGSCVRRLDFYQVIISQFVQFVTEFGVDVCF